MSSEDRSFSSSLDDLLDELRAIDARQNPERAAELGRRIGQFSEAARASALGRRSERRSLSKRGRVVGYTTVTYPAVLVTCVGALLLFNSIQLVRGVWLAVIPVSIQLALLASLALRHFSQIYIVRVWAGIGILAGAAGIVGILARLVQLATSAPGDHVEVAPGPLQLVSLALLPLDIYLFTASIRSTKFERGEYDHAKPSPSAV